MGAINPENRRRNKQTEHRLCSVRIAVDDDDVVVAGGHSLPERRVAFGRYSTNRDTDGLAGQSILGEVIGLGMVYVGGW